MYTKGDDYNNAHGNPDSHLYYYNNGGDPHFSFRAVIEGHVTGARIKIPSGDFGQVSAQYITMTDEGGGVWTAD